MKNIHKNVEKWLTLCDDGVINFLDKITTYIQKKGWSPLNSIKMCVICLFWFSLINANKESSMLYFVIISGAIFLVFDYLNWREECGYWDDVRKTKYLNAKTITWKLDRKWWRISIVLVMLTLIIPDILAGIGWSTLGSVLAVTINYLHCCMYMGPGDYSKSKKEKLSALPQGV